MTELGSIKERELSEGVECMKFVKRIFGKSIALMTGFAEGVSATENEGEELGPV